jgi:hypothetical protein
MFRTEDYLPQINDMHMEAINGSIIVDGGRSRLTCSFGVAQQCPELKMLEALLNLIIHVVYDSIDSKSFWIKVRQRTGRKSN